MILKENLDKRSIWASSLVMY